MLQIDVALEIVRQGHVFHVCQYLRLTREFGRPLGIESEGVLVELLSRKMSADEALISSGEQICRGTDLGWYVAAEIRVRVLGPCASNAI